MLKFLTRPRTTSAVSLTPPEPCAARAGLAVVLIVRNEARHIAEWARFHRLAGAAHFLVYDDGCTDATLPRLAAALPGGALTVLPWHQQFRDAHRGTILHNQVLAYAHAVANFGARFRWMAFLDADEFLVPVAHDTLDAALEGLAGCPHISLPWHMFGTSGHVAPPAGGVVRNHTRRAADPMGRALNFKTVLDPCRVTRMAVHRPQVDGGTRTCNDAGEAGDLRSRNGRGFLSTARLQLNHYYTRSRSEMEAKIARGSNLKTGDRRHAARMLRKMAAIEAEEVTDTAAPDFLARRGVGPQDWP